MLGVTAGAAQSVRARPQAPASASSSRDVGGTVPRVMLGIDVLEADGFRQVKGKRIGLLTHAAGVNRRGARTIDVLRNAKGVRLVALYAVEHGIDGKQSAEESFGDSRDPRTGLPVYSLYKGKGPKFKPTPDQLRGIDALVIDLQDIGTRSYTFSGAMKRGIEGCFENGKEVIVLDRPNPLGGLKADGPPLDADLMSDVGRFRVPYVHGLTMGELARMAVDSPPPGGLAISASAKSRGRLTIVPMRGWRRDMRWKQTGLKFVPTSEYIEDVSAVVGYAMVGLGCQSSGFMHGIGGSFPFRELSFSGKTAEQLVRDLNALRLPGLKFTRAEKSGQLLGGVLVQVSDWNAWNPTELSFHMMRLACRYKGSNPFANLSDAEIRSLNVHVGSAAWLRALQKDGARVNVERFVADWRKQARAYHQQSRKYWLYR
jgi:uncharacterized protein YbbC (DUF1343 family)